MAFISIAVEGPEYLQRQQSPSLPVTFRSLMRAVGTSLQYQWTVTFKYTEISITFII